MIPAMNEVGRLFEQGEVFVPEMLVSAHAMKGGMELLQPLLENAAVKPIAKVVMGTVQGRRARHRQEPGHHDAQGRRVRGSRPGRQRGRRPALWRRRANGAAVVGMSALLTTTMPNMKVTIDHFVAAGHPRPGQDYRRRRAGNPGVCRRIGADGYGANANQAVTVAKALLGVEA